MGNSEIRNIFTTVKKKGITKWMVADEIGISDTTFSKWMRKELLPERRLMILAAIEKLSKETVGNG